MNSSFRIKDPSHYIDLGVPSSLTQPFPKDNRIKLFIEPYLNGLNKETAASDHKQKEKLFIEPYSLSIISRRVHQSPRSEKKSEEEDGGSHKSCPKRSLDEDEEVYQAMFNNKRRRLIQYVHHNREGNSQISNKDLKGSKVTTSSNGGEKRKKDCDNPEESSSAWIKLSNGQVIRVPQSMLLNIQLLKQKAASSNPTPSPPNTATSTAAMSSFSPAAAPKVAKEKKGVTPISTSCSSLPGSGIALNNKQPLRKVGIVSNTAPPTVIPPPAATLVQPVKSLSSSPILLAPSLQKEAHNIKAHLSKVGPSLKAMPIGIKKTVTLEKPNSSTVVSLGKSLSSIVANSQLPQSHIIALKTQEKNGQVIYLKSIPNQKPPTPGATRLIVTQPAAPNQQRLNANNVNHQVLSHSSGSGIQLPLKTTVKQPVSSSSDGGLPTSTRSPILVKRIIPSELPICNSQAKQGKSCSNSVGSPINGKYRDIMKLSTTLKHVLSQSTVPSEVVMPKEASKSSRSMVILKSDPLTNNESNSKSYDHDYSITPRGSKLSEVLMDISKRGIFVETTAVKVDSCEGDKISTMNIALPQKDLLSFVISKTRKEGKEHDSSQLLKSCSGNSTPETSSSSSRKVLLSKSSKLSQTQINSPEQQRVLTSPGSKKTKSKSKKRFKPKEETFYIDEALPQGWFVQTKFNPGTNKNEIYHITSDNMRLRPGRELCDYILHGIVPYSRTTRWVGPKVSLKAMPVRKAVVVCESLCE